MAVTRHTPSVLTEAEKNKANNCDNSAAAPNNNSRLPHPNEVADEARNDRDDRSHNHDEESDMSTANPFLKYKVKESFLTFVCPHIVSIGHRP